MAWEKTIQVGKGGRHPFAQGLIVSAAQERVEPDESLYLSLQLSHLQIKQNAVSSVPTIAEDETQGPIWVQEMSMAMMKLVKGTPDIRTP